MYKSSNFRQNLGVVNLQKFYIYVGNVEPISWRVFCSILVVSYNKGNFKKLVLPPPKKKVTAQSLDLRSARNP